MSLNFYVIEYKSDNEGCPVFLDGVENCDWEWTIYDPAPYKFTITKNYEFRIVDKDVEFLELDYSGSPARFVSQQFLNVCDALGAEYRSVPVKVYLANGVETRKDYFYFLSAQWESLLDESKSEYSLELDMESGKPTVNKFYPKANCYNWINKFTTKRNIESDIFWCSELMELVCSQRFVDESVQCDLKGINFVPINEEYRYDPWNEIPE
ncbi:MULTISPECIES: Imm43 family immunity protein [Pseudomonas]|uniref:Imm43 family immunity protein n=1 Tax=Pseudomonas TaxID=286 RepID=UPI0007307FFC|nr:MULTISPECIES: hypothetical protein [Pseudomonas]KTB95995.1 hypothetical protein AO388_26580 [Pseudomonas sp. ICMP 10191]MCK9694676.1 hypothetical protein [Pseudomonas syringae pv. syringae]MCK9739620.1 hypothetical protein [Pseudomonas syringae pv. syringae]MCK9749441.1 hypothetical protein [Pseudomonas syringae pv. syringae]MDU8573109.1 hypothetical protein [Pseudomonas syringae]